MVAGMELQGTSTHLILFQICRYLRGEKEVGNIGKKLESAETCIPEGQGRDNWSSYSVQKALSPYIGEARVVMWMAD